jgi:outer membrane protein assembly factor BamE (lipoprotein component of BamABCDE complex)
MNKLASFLLALATAACASYGGSSLQPGSTESEVRSTMGAPAAEFTNTDGTRDLFYPRGPMGTDTFRAKLGPDGVMRDLRNVLTDDTFRNVVPGMTEQDILRMIGPPGKTMPFPISNTHAWDYHYKDTWGNDAIFSVTFDAKGIVLSKLTTRIEGRDRSR